MEAHPVAAALFVVACSGTASSPARLDNTASAPAAPPNAAMIDEVVRAELEHWLRDPAWLPEAETLDASRPIRVQREIEIGNMSGDTFTSDTQQISASALPAGARMYELMSKSALQAEADRSGQEIRFVTLDITFFAGKPDARVGFAVNVLHPSMKKSTVMCCCGATDLFAKRDQHWALTKRYSVACP